RQIETASSTRGTQPPRELRSVATLFTLTDRRTIGDALVLRGEPQFAPYDLGNLFSPLPDLSVVLPFDHHPQQRLGTRIPDEEAALTADPALDLRNRRRHSRNGVEIHLLPHGNIQQHLRIAHQIGREVAQRATRHRDRPEDVERRTEAV